jgi:5-methyltetrahydropteroyltriglutamate--homocysteine methyltransferase
MTINTLVTGFPRIGEKRELKKALESYWAQKISSEDLHRTASEIRKRNWLYQKNNGIDLISINDFSLYDNMLDTVVMLDAVPERFIDISDKTEQYFAMARGCSKAVAMEMTKWFNTNYHYIVPELSEKIKFRADISKIVLEYNEAKAIGITPKINITGPLTFLGLSTSNDGKDTYRFFDSILPAYIELLKKISTLDSEIYVQFDEPVFVKAPSEHMLYMLKKAYSTLSATSNKIRIIVTTYFEHSNEASVILGQTPIWGIGLDFVYGQKNIEILDKIKGKKLIAGVVDGRNIWINDIKTTVSQLKRISDVIPENDIIISTSCSLLHVPYTVKNENESNLRNWLSFACEKINEVVLIDKLFRSKVLIEQDRIYLDLNKKFMNERRTSTEINDKIVQERIKNIARKERSTAYTSRIAIQKKQFNLPVMPTTTIGSFPQTGEIRKLRNDFKKGTISTSDYEAGIKHYIDDCITFQEKTGLDVLVHGEPERNDMVEYFGEMLKGFHFTFNGWVQSYGSRCVKPPVIFGDVSRPEPMTVKWITYAQSRTNKIMKGMLTGPVTIVNWSFVRNDIPKSDVSRQIALCLSDEIRDLQAAGIKIIQVDEAAFKEGYPIKQENIPEYEDWAVKNFRLAVSTAEAGTQIHTHMCYSEFDDIIKTIESMDADVITIETARSGNRLLDIFRRVEYKNEIGPGVYDIHSPRIPPVEEFLLHIKALTEVIPAERLWINPDCGLKTRKWEEVKPALTNMVAAVKKFRSGQ